MKRLKITQSKVFTTFGFAAALGLLGACNKPAGDGHGEEHAAHDEGHGDHAEEAAPAEQAKAAPTGEPGNIKVTVKFEGAAPKAAAIPEAKADAYCKKSNVSDESVKVDAGVLHNVAIAIDEVEGDFEAAEGSTAMIDQNGCSYAPRVVTMTAGQSIAIKNSDKTLHNVHGYKGEDEENWFNKPQPPQSPDLNEEVDDQGMLKCDVHPWMKAYIKTFEHPFHAVTNGSNKGVVEFKGVPSSEDTYTIKTWHEVYGEQEAEVSVEAGKTAEVTITYSAS